MNLFEIWVCASTLPKIGLWIFFLYLCIEKLWKKLP
jgi:hypothetical protein